MKKITAFYLLASLVIAISIYKDFGVSWDETMQRATAQVNFDYIIHNDEGLKTWVDRDYGVVFELPLYVFEKVFHWKKDNGDEREIFLYRHLLTHLLFIIGGVFLFLLVSQLFESKIYGVLALFYYYLNPRIFGHSFINSKDIPLMVMFIICFYLFYKFTLKRNFKNLIPLSFATAVLINIRIVGVIFPVASIFYILIFDCVDFKFSKIKDSVLHVVLYLVGCSLFIYMLWPNLWSNPIDNFIESFVNMSKFRHDSYELTYGKWIKASLDKSYFFKWFFTTNPIKYLLFGTMGLVLLIFSIIKSKMTLLKNKQFRYIAFLSSLFVFPLAIIIVKGSVLYSGWRQLFFVYPSFIILILFSFYYFKKSALHKYLIIFSCVYFVFILQKIIRLHPYQMVYFNEVISNQTEYRARNFEYEYWGTGFREALENLVKQDASSEIKIAISGEPGFSNSKMLSLNNRKRIIFVEDYRKADYYLTNVFSDYEQFPKSQRVFNVQRENSTIISIYKVSK